MKNFKPMLGCDCGDTATLKFPLLASPKLDGVRAIIRDGVVMSRSLKPIPNENVQALLGHLPEGLDGELIVYDPTAPDAYRRTVSVVMSETKPSDDVLFHVFDHVSELPFYERHLKADGLTVGQSAVVIVPHTLITNLDGLLDYEADVVGQGYEGVMLRDTNGPYKFGRSTRNEGYLLKLKRFADSEAEVIGVVELMHNGNEAKTNALGRTERSTHKAGKTGLNMLGALQVRDVKTGVEFEIGTGFTAAERAGLWALGTGGVIGRLAKYKYFPGGSKDKPRFPVFLGWRDQRDR